MGNARRQLTGLSQQRRTQAQPSRKQPLQMRKGHMQPRAKSPCGAGCFPATSPLRTPKIREAFSLCPSALGILCGIISCLKLPRSLFVYHRYGMRLQPAQCNYKCASCACRVLCTVFVAAIVACLDAVCAPDIAPVRFQDNCVFGKAAM